MTCKCEKKEYAVYAKSDDASIADIVHCVECKFEDSFHKCLRFTSSVTGHSYPISCIEARNEDSLCGYYGRFWVKKGE